MVKSCDSTSSENVKLRILEDKLRTDLAPKDMTILPDCDNVIDNDSQFYIYENGELRHITWDALKGNFDLSTGDASNITIQEGNWYLDGIDTGVKAQGPQGPQGEAGKAGANGKDGKDGKDGVDGKDGQPGIDGKNGLPGIKGDKGDKGDPGIAPRISPDGYWWVGTLNTNTKAQGPKGDKGERGEPGCASVATIGDNGNWYIDGKNTGVSAKGPKGDTGLQGPKGDKGLTGDIGPVGPKGDKGEQGEAGKNGITPSIGENGNWWIGGIDTTIKAEGQDGAEGRGIVSITRSNIDTEGLVDTYAINYTSGDPSTFTVTNGKNGIIPHIGENNHWFIGDKDTQVVATGKDGTSPHIDKDTGNWFIGEIDTEIHAQGEKGEKGDKGDIGQHGIDGQDGKDGNDVLHGYGIPSNNIGSIEDSYIDLNNWNYYIKEKIGWVKKGNIKGEPGKDGQTPYISENGNWWIGNIDTAVKAKGQDGKDGASGKDGTAGKDGKNGNKILVGNGEPLENSGIDGDYYLNMDNSNVYSKTIGSWVKSGILKGAASKVIAKGGWDNAIPLTTFVEPIENFKTLIISFYHKDANPSRAFTITVPTSILVENKAVHKAVCFYKWTGETSFEELQICDASVSIDRSETPSLKVELSSAYLKNNNVVILPHSAKTATWIAEVIGEN